MDLSHDGRGSYMHPLESYFLPLIWAKSLTTHDLPISMISSGHDGYTVGCNFISTLSDVFVSSKITEEALIDLCLRA